MRSFALEKYSGTFETLMTVPVSDAQVVLAKFTGAMAFYIITWLPLLGCLLILRYVSHDAGLLDAGTIASTYLGIILPDDAVSGLLLLKEHVNKCASRRCCL